MSFQMPCVLPLFPLAALQFFGLCRTVPSSAFSLVAVSQTPASRLSLFVIEGEKIPRKYKPRIRYCRFLYFTRPSTPLVKVLEAASLWHWAWWRVLGGTWWKYLILFQLSPSFFFFSFPGWSPELRSPANLKATLPQGPLHKYTLTHGSDQHFDLLWLADQHCNQVWLYQQCTIPAPAVASGSASQGSGDWPCMANISTSYQKSPARHATRLSSHDFPSLFSKFLNAASPCPPI